MTLLRVIGRCPLPSRANMHKGWRADHGAVKDQRAAVVDHLSDWCNARGLKLRTITTDKPKRPWHLALPKDVPCPPPYEVHMVRVPRKGGRLLDSGAGGNMDQCLKAVRDAVAEMLGAPNDAVDWIAWTGGQRKREAGNPDNSGCELLELTIGPRGEL
jgi:hypothetical protein